MWDFAQSLQTGDWEFNAQRDFKSAEGLGLLQQRIHRRLMIGRGEYIYDRTGSLGSRLRALLGMGVPAAAGGLEGLVREALEPMNDEITITDVVVNFYGDGTGIVDSSTTVRATIDYQLNRGSAEVAQSVFGGLSTQVDIGV